MDFDEGDNMKYILFFLMVFSFHVQVFSIECQDMTLEQMYHINYIDEPNYTELTFTYKDESENQHQYRVFDVDRSLSLVTVLNIHLAKEDPDLTDDLENLIHNLAQTVFESLQAEIEKRRSEGDLIYEKVIGSRVDLLDQFLAADLSNNDVLVRFNNDFLHDLRLGYVPQGYRVFHHTDYDQRTNRYDSFQVIEQGLDLKEESNGFENVLGPHLLQCPIQGNLGTIYLAGDNF